MLDFEDLLAIAPEQTWIPVSEADQINAQRQIEPYVYSHSVAYERAYRNCLCLNALQTWLRSEQGPPPPHIWSPTLTLPELWEFVEGVALTIANTRIVLLPEAALDPSELVVPQEWVDIPEWAAHYYFSVQLNPESHCLRIIGYTSHSNLKATAAFDFSDRTYRLSRTSLIHDLNIFWIARELSRQPDLVVAPLASLSPDQVPTLLDQLSQVTYYSPRLELEFAQWAPLMANPTWSHDLYQRRSQAVSNNADATTTSSEPASASVISQVGQQMRHILQTGKQVIQDLLEPTPTFALARGTQITPHGRLQLQDYGFEIRFACTLDEAAATTPPVISILLEVKPELDQPLAHELQIQIFSVDRATGLQQEEIEDIIPIHTSSPIAPIPLMGRPGERFSVALTFANATGAITFEIRLDNHQPVIIAVESDT